MLLLPMQNSSFSLVLLMYPYNLSALPIKTNGAFPLLCCDKIEHNEWHLESANLQAASRSYHVLLLQCHLLTFFTKQNVYLICSFLRMHLLKSRSPGGATIYISIYIYASLCIHLYNSLSLSIYTVYVQSIEVYRISVLLPLWIVLWQLPSNSCWLAGFLAPGSFVAGNSSGLISRYLGGF